MPLEELAFLQQLTILLKPEQPLEAHSSLYVPLYEPYKDDEDGYIEPTNALLGTINLNNISGESIQYFSGFRGSGKSTLLKQLTGKLESAGYIALYADANQFISKNAPISITDLLYTLAVAFGNSAKIKDNKLKELWLNLWEYLSKTNVEVKELGLSTDFASVNLELKGNETFRSRFRKAFETHVEQLNREVRHYFEQTVKTIQNEHGKKQIVFIFDNLEKIEGADLASQLEVQRSIEFIFHRHQEKLRLPYIHMIYTIPPWLKFLKPLENDTTMLSGVRMWRNNPERSEKEEGLKRLRTLLQKRFAQVEQGSWERFFGTNADTIADTLIRASGGDIRDLFRMVSAAMLRTQRKLPVSEGVIASAINQIRGNYLPLNESNAVLIEEVARTRTVNPENEQIEKIKSLIDSHMILFFKNGGEWYDANQMILPEAIRIVEAIQKRNEPPTN
jgi:energy-coupling factor transporter ATP-binding protein EcfA2